MAIKYPDIDSIGWGDDVNDNFRELSQNDTDIKTVIGTEEMGTTATTLKGAIAENTTQLNEITQKITLKNENIIALNGWSDIKSDNPVLVAKNLNDVSLIAELQGGITTNDTKVLQLPTWAYPYKKRSFQVTSCDIDWVYKVGVITIDTIGQVKLSGNIFNTKLIISLTYPV